MSESNQPSDPCVTFSVSIPKSMKKALKERLAKCSRTKVTGISHFAQIVFEAELKRRPELEPNYPFYSTPSMRMKVTPWKLVRKK